MCTLGAVKGRYLFKNRDMSSQVLVKEEIITGMGIYSYIGIAGTGNQEEAGLNSGINAKGIAAGVTYVGDGRLEEEITEKKPRGFIVEEILKNCSNLEQAKDMAVSFLTDHIYVGGNIIIASREGVVSIEEYEGRFSAEIHDSGIFVRANHFCNLELPDGSLKHYKESKIRYDTMREYLSTRYGAGLSLEEVKTILKSHDGEAPICKHKGKALGVTVSSVIYDLETRKMYYARGNPCENEYSILKISN